MDTERSGNCLTVDLIVYNAVNESFKWGPGIQEHYAIHYVKKGRGFFECVGKKYPVAQGQCFLLNPGLLVHYYPDDAEPWEYAWISFSGTAVKKLLMQTTAFSPAPVSGNVGDTVAALLREAACNFRRHNAAADMRNIGYFYLILSQLTERFPAYSEKRSQNWAIYRTAEFIEQNYRRHDLNIELLANEMKMNRISLYRNFMREFDISPKQYMIEVRMSRAKELLRSSEFSVKSIAYSVGYSDQLYFAKVFRKKTGYTPSAYRELNAGP